MCGRQRALARLSKRKRIMCPFFVALRPIGYCGCYGEGSFHPNIKRKKKYCVGKFSDCLFYQWETKPVIIKPARKL